MKMCRIKPPLRRRRITTAALSPPCKPFEGQACSTHLALTGRAVIDELLHNAALARVEPPKMVSQG